jgi:hypothetical protein
MMPQLDRFRTPKNAVVFQALDTLMQFEDRTKQVTIAPRQADFQDWLPESYRAVFHLGAQALHRNRETSDGV